MPAWTRPIGLALFCAAFGFGGGLAGAYVAGDDGPASVSEQTGDQGPAGPQGPTGPRGPAGQPADLSEVESALLLLDGRLDDLEASSGTDGGCSGLVTFVVTDIDTYGDFDPTFDVQRSPFPVCLQAP